MNEAISPPTNKDRERRDTEFVRVAQQRYRQGFLSRIAKLHPMKRNAQGEQTQIRESKWSYAEHANSICPDFMSSHERERWISGFLFADGICATKGLAAAKNADPGKVRRNRPASLAEPLDMGLDTPLSRDEAEAFWKRHRGQRVGHAPTLPDAEADR